MGKGPNPEDVSGRDDQEGGLGLGGSVVSPDYKTQTTSRFLQPDDGFHPRAKLEFPTYDGKEDPLPWLNRCETFFRGQNTPNAHKMWYASLHMTRPAQLWYFRLELNTGAPSWRSFVKLVHTCFGPPMTDSPLGELKLLHRTSTVEDYCDSFMAMPTSDAATATVEVSPPAACGRRRRRGSEGSEAHPRRALPPEEINLDLPGGARVQRKRQRG